MTQLLPLLSALKHALRAQGKTYVDVAKWLNLSEASVKRMFAQQHMSLERLEIICHSLEMEISDLVHQMEGAQANTTSLTYQQEFEIAQDLELVLVTVCAFNHWSLNDIVDHFTLSESACIKKLLKLEKIGLIDLMPGNRIKLRISKRFHWLENGPFEQFFRQHIGQEFFNHHFKDEQQCLRVANATLPKNIIIHFQKKLDELMKELAALNREYATLPVEQKEGMTMVLAMRDWDYGLFSHLIRKNTQTGDSHE